MSYLVLARKYRPQTFKEVVGQDHVTTPLQNALQTGKIAHAYLFTGTRGVGKTTCARILAKALNCLSSDKPVAEPCNKCISCVEITQGASLDVLEIDGASYTSVDNIREIRDTLTYVPTRSRYKVYIIDEVHMLSIAAFNALLKMLEEPPRHVIFVFATTEPHKIPKTVLSRCQRYDFKTIPINIIAKSLKDIVKKEKIEVSEDVIWLVARKGQGSLRDAISYLDQIIASGNTTDAKHAAMILGAIDRNDILDIVEAIANHDSKSALSIFQRLKTQAYDTRQFLWELMEITRNLVVAKLAENSEDYISGTKEEVERIKRIAESHSLEALKELYKQVNASSSEILFSLDPLMSLEMLVVRLASMPAFIAVDEILGKLNELRGKLASSVSAQSVPISGAERSLFDQLHEESTPQPQAQETKLDKDICQDFLRHLKAVYPHVYALVEDLDLARAEPNKNKFVIYAPKERIGLLKTSYNDLKRAIEKVIGIGADIEILERSEAPTLRQEQAQREQRPRRHPIIKHAVDLFDADIVEVKRRNKP